ncbi:MAG TPA: DNA translocase FtsK 4TM domain-containing protein, partial [Elusimicrobiales bacterium]|nr:DNA translocase FtsK 4TM domain-containing protein [Elusimicrobiales bacterium]
MFEIRGTRSGKRAHVLYRLAASGGKKKPGGLAYAAYWLLSFSFCIWLFWLLFTPVSKGAVGGAVSGRLFAFFGPWNTYLVPFLLLYGLVAILLQLGKPHKGILTLTLGMMLILGAISTALEFLGVQLASKPGYYGGWLGETLDTLVSNMFGSPGAALFSLVTFLIGLQLLFKISWMRLWKLTRQTIADDYRNWAAARAQLKARLKIISDREAAEGPAYAGVPIPEAPPALKGPEKPVPPVPAEPDIVR